MTPKGQTCDSNVVVVAYLYNRAL